MNDAVRYAYLSSGLLMSHPFQNDTKRGLFHSSRPMGFYLQIFVTLLSSLVSKEERGP